MTKGHNNKFMNNLLIWVRVREIETDAKFLNWAALGYFVTTDSNLAYTSI